MSASKVPVPEAVNLLVVMEWMIVNLVVMIEWMTWEEKVRIQQEMNDNLQKQLTTSTASTAALESMYMIILAISSLIVNPLLSIQRFVCLTSTINLRVKM